MVRCMAFASLLSACLLSGGARAASGQSEYAQVADRGPRFLSAETTSGEFVDASAAAPLHRRVSLSLEAVTLGEALRAITTRAGLEIAYSSRVVPLARRVSIHASAITIAAALTEILLDTGVDVSVSRTGELALVPHNLLQAAPDSFAVAGRVVDKTTGAPLVGAEISISETHRTTRVGEDGRYRLTGLKRSGTYTVTARYIGYTPQTLPAAEPDSTGDEAVMDFALERSAQRLDQVVVTGTVVPTEVKALPSPITIVTGEDIERENPQRIDQIFRGTVPSGFSWERGQNDYSSSIGVRGTTSLATTPIIKTYIDGIEVADPVMLATIDPASVERIEVARGPQASTIYGSDASGGVMQVFTKRGTFGARPHVSVRAAFGAMDGHFASGTPLRQALAFDIRGGGGEFRYNAGATFTNVGEWAPDYYSRSPSFFAGGEWRQGRVGLALSARRSSKSFSWIDTPLLNGLTFFSRPSYRAAALNQQTYGLTASYHATQRWNHELTLGQDQTDFDFHLSQRRLTTPADTFLQVAAQSVSRASVRYHTSYDRAVSSGVTITIIGGAEYSEAKTMSSFTLNATRASSNLDGTTFVNRDPVTNAGYFGQAQIGFRDALFVTGGLRAEHNSSFGDSFGTAWSPRVGVSYVRSLGGLAVKLRGSYGNAIRAPAPAFKGGYQDTFTHQLANPLLGPERQHGWDSGVEVSWGALLFLGVTYYRQLADDLIDPVTVDATGSPPTTQFQNVGRIRNTGWEVEGKVQLSRISLQGSYSRPRSTVERLSPTYQGNLKVGDDLLGIPRDIAGVTLDITPWSATDILFGLSRFGPWTSTDFLTLYQVYFGNATYRGSARDYWIKYPSVTKLKLSINQRISHAVTGFVQIDNLGNNRRFEDNNLNVPLGRVIQTGVRAEF